ncbi:invertase inhibitor [Populus alba x Populus x berolinensis]|nr:invertase inhibitor [Populus alba x Populus x berolinensis]
MPTFSHCLLLLLLPLLFSAFNANIAQNLIPETCKKCAADDPNLSYNFCVTSLQASNRSQCDNLRGLGMMSIKACLNDCLDLYSDAIPTLKQAMVDYKSKHYKDANIEVSSVIDAATTCEDGFEEKEEPASSSQADDWNKAGGLIPHGAPSPIFILKNKKAGRIAFR